jgi:hypothetical protein
MNLKTLTQQVAKVEENAAWETIQKKRVSAEKLADIL